MISVLIGVLGLFFPVLASAAGADLKSVERSDHAIMIVLPQALDETGPRRLKDGDCDNGPWLSRGGRKMAEAMGGVLRDAGFASAPVYASPSCAAIEAAELLGLKMKGTLPFLDDVTQTAISRTKQREALALFMADNQGGATMILMTHRSNVIDLSGLYPSFGDAILLSVDLSRFEPVFLRKVQVKPASAED